MATRHTVRYALSYAPTTSFLVETGSFGIDPTGVSIRPTVELPMLSMKLSIWPLKTIKGRVTPQTKLKEQIKENIPAATTTCDSGSAANMGESMEVMMIPVHAAVMICQQP